MEETQKKRLLLRAYHIPHSPIIYGNRVETHGPYSHYYTRAISEINLMSILQSVI